MKASSANRTTRHERLNTFEILCLILEAVDRGMVQVGPAGTPSFRRIWAQLSSPVDRGRWIYAWKFILDEEMVVIRPGNGIESAWRLTREGRILLRELRSGVFSPAPTRGRRNALAGPPDRGKVPPPNGRHH